MSRISWLLSLSLFLNLFNVSLAGPIVAPTPAPTLQPYQLDHVLHKRATKGDPFWCSPAAVTSKCPSPYCLCTSTNPQPWVTQTIPPLTAGSTTWAALTLTLSEVALQFDLLPSDSDPKCPWTRKEDAGPSIWLADPVNGQCGPASTFTSSNNDPSSTSVSGLPDLPSITAASAYLDGLHNNICHDPSKLTGGGPGQPPQLVTETLTPGGICASTLTAPWNCLTTAVAPIQVPGQPEKKMSWGALCGEQKDYATPTGSVYHVIQPDDNTGAGSVLWSTQAPMITAAKAEFDDQQFVEPNCPKFWMDTGPDGLGAFKNNPCAGLVVTTPLTIPCTTTQSGDKDACACGQPDSKIKVPMTTFDHKCSGDQPYTATNPSFVITLY